ncbi:putative DNA primase/helicase [Actimicrobium sp. GrIS 1.19]|uniref:DNA primase family protein n=1 Tax=Actimicrobium sp. GrIS 1.19 TaxID=3071708 RepID=UPI002E0278A8|nr:putative DNA primase/helicase [Actimicrobium sp. GrIS 1.19]
MRIDDTLITEQDTDSDEVDSGSVFASSQPVHIYPKGALQLIQSKCPTMRNYCHIGVSHTMSEALVSGLNRELASFEGGIELAHAACSNAPGFVQTQFDTDIVAAGLPNQPKYTCKQIRADGATTCPEGGCPMPTGENADAPADLLTWACNMNEVGLPVIAKSVVASEFGNNIVRVGDALYIYREGTFSEVSDLTLGTSAVPHLGLDFRPRHVDDIVKMMRIQSERSEVVFRPNPNFICFQNGTLNVATKALEPHSPVHKLLNQIPHPYPADEECPGFIAYLNDIWGGDIDCAEKIQLIRQWIGYLLVADSSMQKMLIFHGQGANGKSVLMDLIRQIVGEDNTASAMLDRLRQSYVRATMEGTLLNVSADLPRKSIVADGDLKALISGDAIEVALKHKPSRTIRPYVRMMVATNNMPDCKDTSDGFFRRLIILKFNRQFTEAERDPNLLTTLLLEIPGIIAWALEGLYELRTQGRFSIPESSEQAVKLYRDDISPVRIFTEECLVAAPGQSGIPSHDLFSAYRKWCQSRGFYAGNTVTLGRELSALGFSQRKSGTTWWQVTPKADAQEYFRPAQVVVQTLPPLPGS